MNLEVQQDSSVAALSAAAVVDILHYDTAIHCSIARQPYVSANDCVLT